MGRTGTFWCAPSRQLYRTTRNRLHSNNYSFYFPGFFVRSTHVVLFCYNKGNGNIQSYPRC